MLLAGRTCAEAKLYFWSGFNGYGAYAEGIVELQKAVRPTQA